MWGTEENYEVLDRIGDWQGNPGDGWDVAGVTNATKDHTLVRKSTVMVGNAGYWSASAGTNADDSGVNRLPAPHSSSVPPYVMTWVVML